MTEKNSYKEEIESLLVERLPKLKRFHYDPLSHWIQCETYDGLLYRYFLPTNHYWRRFADDGKKLV